MTAEQTQLVEQLKLTGAQIAQAMGVPLYKLGIGQPTLNNLSALNQHYFADTIQPHVEAIEALLDEGLNLAPDATELDTKNLLRMDPESLMSMLDKGLSSSAMAVNEARTELNLPPVKGGDEPLSQQQYWPLSVLQNRPPPSDAVAPVPAPTTDEDEENAETEARALIETIRKGFEYAV
jgi:phage portal protein BeeE